MQRFRVAGSALVLGLVAAFFHAAPASAAIPDASVHIHRQAYEGQNGTILASYKSRCAPGFEFAESVVDFSQGSVSTPSTFGQPIPCDGKWHEQSGYQLARDLMRLPAPPDALFCASDSIAVGALDALHELGARVPEDVALVGFDDRHFSQYQRPPLTTVHYQHYRAGVESAELLVDILEGPAREHARHIVLPVELVIRGSTGVPKAQPRGRTSSGAAPRRTAAPRRGTI